MPGELHKIVYCSRNLIQGEQPFRATEVAQILKASRKNNQQLNVTGALLYSATFFAQVLEGPQQSIEKIFERIQQDDRHGEVTVLESSHSDRRDFPEWSMAHVQPPSPSDFATIAVALDRAMLAPGDSAGDVLTLLRTLVIQAD